MKQVGRAKDVSPAVGGGGSGSDPLVLPTSYSCRLATTADKSVAGNALFPWDTDSSPTFFCFDNGPIWIVGNPTVVTITTAQVPLGTRILLVANIQVTEVTGFYISFWRNGAGYTAIGYVTGGSGLTDIYCARRILTMNQATCTFGVAFNTEGADPHTLKTGSTFTVVPLR